MASTFAKRYDVIREDFYKSTKQFPQLKTSADGKMKSSGVGEDVRKLDALLDSDKLDPAKLAAVFQDFSKHARVYAEQISFTPGKGIFDWMTKAGAVPKEQVKLIEGESKKFQTRLESLIKDVDGTVQVELEKGKSRSQTNKVLQTIREDVGTWAKYADLPGVKVVADPKTTTLLLNPERNQPATDILNACKGVQTAVATLTRLVGAVAKIDTSPILPSSVKKSVAAMDGAMKEFMDCVQDLKNSLLTWNNEYSSLVKMYEKKFKATPDPVAEQKFGVAKTMLDQLSPAVETAKRRVGENLELKVITTRKLLSTLAA